MSSKNLHNESDDDFTYMGEENDDIETESESQQISSGRINKDGKKVRGKDKVWLDLEIKSVKAAHTFRKRMPLG